MNIFLLYSEWNGCQWPTMHIHKCKCYIPDEAHNLAYMYQNYESANTNSIFVMMEYVNYRKLQKCLIL